MKKKAKNFVGNFISVLKQPEMLILPGQLAFFFIMSIVPILTLISYVASTFNLSIDIVTNFVEKMFSSDVANLIAPSVSNPALNVGFFITLIIGFIMASNGAASIIVTSNTIYGIKDKGFIKRRLKSIIMTIVIVLLFVFILLVPLFGNKILNTLSIINIKNIKIFEFIINLLNGPISWLIIFLFIKLIYIMAPDIKIQSIQTNYGAIFTTFGWIIATSIYSIYINNYAYYSIFYGGLANIIVLMLWLYILALIFTIGLALNYKKEINTKNNIDDNDNNTNRSDK